MMKEVTVGLIGNSSSSSLIFMADKIDDLKLGFENLIIELVVPGIRLGAISVKAGRTQSSPTGPPSDSPMPFTTIHSRQDHHSHGCHLHPLFLAAEGEAACRETQKTSRRKHEEQLNLEQ